MSIFSVDIVDHETIKPSVATPPHLSTMKLSLMDQLLESVYIPKLLFFSSPTEDATVHRLKKTLSETLSLFYPFAGRIVDNRYVHCNDQGVNFIETRVNTRMENVLINPITDYLLPLIPHQNKLDPTALLTVQINIFDCGGMALCAYLAHQITNASSMVFFLNTWASITREAAHKLVLPNFSTWSFFPLSDTNLRETVSTSATQKEFVSKRFVFNASQIATLQAKCSTKLYRPSRVQAVTAYLWRCAMNAAETTSSMMTSTLNLRIRMDPPLSAAYIGNLVFGLLATAKTKGLPSLPYLAGQLQKEISKIDSEYVRKLQVDNGVLKVYDSYTQQMMELSAQDKQASIFGITSLSRFPLYEADFGWGKPDWVTIVNISSPDFIILMDTKCGTGFEAWVSLSEQRMGKFECNPDLVASASEL